MCKNKELNANVLLRPYCIANNQSLSVEKLSVSQCAMLAYWYNQLMLCVCNLML